MISRRFVDCFFGVHFQQFCWHFISGLSVDDFKDPDSIEHIEYRHKSGVDLSAKQCQT